MRGAATVVLAAVTGCTLFSDRAPTPAVIDAEPADAASPECGFVTCAPGDHCEARCAAQGVTGCTSPCFVTCVPDVPCSAVACGRGASCVERCSYDCDGFAWVCHQTCEPHGAPGTCGGPVACDAAPPACPVGTVPGVSGGCYSGYCVPAQRCGTTDPGACGTRTVTCEALPPVCPPGTSPGVFGTCWSGYCIPDRDCPCDALDTEVACAARTDCAPVHRGGGCDCEGLTCSCLDPTSAFMHCRPR